MVDYRRNKNIDMNKKTTTKRSHKHDVALHRQRSQSYLGDLFSEPISINPQVKRVRSEKTEHEHLATDNIKDIADKHDTLWSSTLKNDLSPEIPKEQDRRLIKRDLIRTVAKAKDIARLKPRGKDLSDISPYINIKESVCGEAKSDEETGESSLPAQTSTSDGDSDNKRYFHTISDSSSFKVRKKPLSCDSEDETVPFVEENCDSTSSKIGKMPLICHNDDETIPYMEGNSEHRERSSEESFSSGVDISRKIDFTDGLNFLFDGREQHGHDVIYSDISDEKSRCKGMDVVHSNSYSRIEEEAKYSTDGSEKTLFAIAPTIEESHADSLNNCLTPFGNSFNNVTSSPADLNESFLTSHLDMDSLPKDLTYNNFLVRGCKRRIRHPTPNQIENVSSSKEKASEYIQRLCPVLNDTNIPPEVQNLPHLPDSDQTFIESLEEEGHFDLGVALLILENIKYSIPQRVTGLLLNYGILDPNVTVINFNRSCQMLQEVCARTPGSVDLSWSVVSECCKRLTSPQSFKDGRQRKLRLLEFLVNIIKADLRGHLSNIAHMPTTQAYKLLAYSVANSNRTELIHFLGKCLQDEYFTDDNIKKKVVHLIQTLLTLCVEVSSSCVDCTNGLSQELKLLYTHLPAGDSGRSLLLSSISSPLLSLKLCQLLLETQYTDTRAVDTLGLPNSLAEIRRAYFQAVPIKTPMPAESDSSYEEGKNEAQKDTEELCYIILTCVTSFLQVAKGNYEKPLRLRKPRATSGMLNMTERRDFRDHVDRLEVHLRSLSPNLSRQCENYLARLKILVDAD